MDNISEIMDDISEIIVEKFKVFQASQEFDKEALREAHEKTFKGQREMASMGWSHQYGTMRKASEHWRPSVPLKGLQPIRARELQIDKIHQGRVLFGTLCVDAYRMVGIVTLLEDQFGDAVRLAIYNTAGNQSASSLYPKGSKVAVKQPYFKQGAQDGVLILRVDNPQDVEILASLPGKAESSLVKDLLQLRNEGNKYFRNEDWNKATHYYSRCIDLALSRDKIDTQVPSASNIQEKVKENLLYSYSNRAEARIRLKEYVDAVQDCEKALGIDQKHLKSLFRKGRAFHYLGEYKLACQCFDRALEQAPDAKDIQLHYEKSKELNYQNQHGKFDLSVYFIKGCSAAELSNFIGPVLIKKSVGRGRGLFATDNADVGDFLLVDNAIAFRGTETTGLKGSFEEVMPAMREVKKEFGLLKGDLEGQIISRAASSARVLQQLEYLADSDEMRVPPMDLFRINNSSWNNYDVCNQVWEVEQHELEKIMRNAGCHIQPIDPYSGMSRRNEKYGLWTLPSFINHSCFHNANCIVVGEAMFVIAARQIEAGEEITIPYFPSLFPLVGREFICRGMGFKCDCKRCMLERSLLSPESSPLQEIVELVDSMDSTMLTDFEIRKIAMRLENSTDVLSTEEKQMIRASFLDLYYKVLGLQGIHSYARTTVPWLWESLNGFEEAVPGNSHCFELFAKLSLFINDEVLFQRALKICRAYMGKHDEGVLKAVLNSVATDVFKPGFTLFGFSEVNS